ncbi:MAG: phospholipid scramblase 1 [Bathelium mastoideum]|nr:MAG: phospholipid scramblase 1 [Bathelium mastoideum]KAI9688786.1 MAG: phospholipid scramblase 1 [Bathelium mastoideum]
MANKIMITFVGTNFLFLVGGALLVAFAVVSRNDMDRKTTEANVANNLLLHYSPITGTLINAIFVFATFLTALPAFILPLNRVFLKLHGWLVVICATFTMIVGLILWFDTLKTKSRLNTIWGEQPASEQSLLQMKFNCCGYANSTSPPFIQDATCTGDLVAATKGGCQTPFTNFSNKFLDLIFTAAFGIVGLDVIHLLSTVVVIKNRQELERYRHIDEKINNGI